MVKVATTGCGKRLEDDLSGPMSCNLGLIEGDSGSIRVKLNYRYPVTKTVEDCQPAVKAAFENAGWKLEQSVHKEKLYYPETAPLVKALLETYRTATPRPSASAAVRMRKCCPTRWPSAPCSRATP